MESPESKPNPPRLPFDILTTIAHVSIPVYRLILAIPRFGRRSLQPSFQVHIQSHFTTHIITKDEDGYVKHVWYLPHRSSANNTYFHRLDGPAYIFYYPNGQKEYERWYEHGIQHRLDGPAYISYSADGSKKIEGWFQNGKRHRQAVLPTAEHPGEKAGPAYITYYADGQKASEEWYQHNQLHRLDDPAVIYQDGREEYWLHGVHYYAKQAYEAELLKLAQQS
jgi:hypothetical protein